jgi:hypothetical protein
MTDVPTRMRLDLRRLACGSRSRRPAPPRTGRSGAPLNGVSGESGRSNGRRRRTRVKLAMPAFSGRRSSGAIEILRSPRQQKRQPELWADRAGGGRERSRAQQLSAQAEHVVAVAVTDGIRLIMTGVGVPLSTVLSRSDARHPERTTAGRFEHGYASRWRMMHASSGAAWVEHSGPVDCALQQAHRPDGLAGRTSDGALRVA